MKVSDLETEKDVDDLRSESKTNVSTSKVASSNEEKDPERQDQKLDYKFSWYWAILAVLSGCLLYYLVHYNDYILPRVITKDDVKLHPSLFSGEISKEYLIKLVSLGPRTFGSSSNQIATPELLRNEINDLISQAHSLHSIKMLKQIGSGGYRIGTSMPYSSIYNDIVNVIVMFEGTIGKHSVLVNCHFDTVPETDGATDDGISCAVMLEMIRALSSDTKRYQHNIIFLFNGAEEVGLVGSRLFLDHEWSKNIKAVVNLEGGGSGGKPVLARSGPKHPWLFNYYAKHAPYPHALVFTEDLFYIVPSESDFRNFRDVGNIPGLDVVFLRNGYVYHTKYDKEEYILAESHQHMGENYLAVVRALGDAQEFYKNDISKGEVSYYDYLGWFIFTYSQKAAIALNVIVTILVIFSIMVFIGRLIKWRWVIAATKCNILGKILKNYKENECGEGGKEDLMEAFQTDGYKYAPLIEFGIFASARLLGMLSATFVTIIVSLIIDTAAFLKMPWFSNVWLIFPIYWCPCLVVYSLVPILIEKYRLKKKHIPLTIACQMSILAAQVPFIFIFFIGTCMGLRSTSILFLPMLTAVIINLITHLTPLCYTTHKWIWVHLILHIPVTLMSMHVVLFLYVVMIPVSGRSGVQNSDLNIAVFTTLFCFLITYFLVPLVLFVRRSRIIYITLSTFSIVMIILSLTTKVGHPYRAGPSNPVPQRFWIMHTTREFRNETGDIRRLENGFYVMNWDANSPQTIPESQRKNLVSLEEDCLKEHYCGVPHYFTRTVRYGPKNSWIPAPPPIQPIPTELTSEKSCDNSSTICTFTFTLKGPARMTVTFATKPGAKLIEWSLPPKPLPTHIRNGRPHYFIHLVRGDSTKEYKMNLTFEVSEEQLYGTPIMDLGVSGNHAYHENWRTEPFKSFLNSLPVWADVMGWISVYKNYVF